MKDKMSLQTPDSNTSIGIDRLEKYNLKQGLQQVDLSPTRVKLDVHAKKIVQ